MTKEELGQKVALINSKLYVRGNLLKFDDGSRIGITVFNLNQWSYEDEDPLSLEELQKLDKVLKKYFAELFKNLK